MDAKDVATEYMTAISEQRFERLAELVHPDATFSGTVKQESRGRDAFVQGFRHRAPILTRIDMRDVVAEHDRAFVLYDFVTDTAAGGVLCGELLRVEGGVIRSSTLIFDWRRWPEVISELQSRTATEPTKRERVSVR